MNDSRSALAEEGKARTGGIGALPYILIFDLLAARDHQSDKIAGERLRLLKYSAPLLAAAHIICGLALFQAVVQDGGRSFSAFLMPLVTVLLLDLAFMFIVWRRSPFSRRPYLVIRATALYVILSGVFWTLLTAPVAAEPLLVGGWLVRAAMVAGFTAGIAAFLATPSLLLLNIGVALVATWMSGASHESLTLVGATVLCLFLYSLFSAREQMLTAEKRYTAEWQSQKAQRFVAEFEQGGRGWFWETDAEGNLTYISEQIAAELNKNSSALLERPLAALFVVLEDDGTDGPERTVDFLLGARFPFSDVTVQAAADQGLWWSLSGSPVFDEFGRFLGFRGIGTEFARQKKPPAAVGRMTRRDPLTGLPNRAMMHEIIGNALGTGELCAMLLIDLDGFSAVAESGVAGDALLKQAAARLVAALGGELDARLGRAGGDTFELLVSGAGADSHLVALADALILQLSLPYTIEGTRISVGASIGIAVAEPGTRDAGQLIGDAEFALDAAKRAGGGTHRHFAASMRSEAHGREMLGAELKEALGRGELRLLYQPMVDSITEDLVGFEALARWEHPKRGMILPEQFIPLAEECGVMVQIGEWVLRTACEAAAGWPANLAVAVNLSPLQLESTALSATVVGALTAAGLGAERLELEITEAAFESANAEETLARLKAIGVRLALDDFGTGAASLDRLRRALFDKVKIDQPVVREAATQGSREAALISSVVTLAEALGFEVTAEGTETYEELSLIRSLGCTQVQGYIFGKPMPLDEALAFTRASGLRAPETCRPARHGVVVTALVTWNDRSFTARIRNMSAGGVMLECERGLAPGARIKLEMIGQGTASGEVRWSDDNRIGVRFDETFAAAERHKKAIGSPEEKRTAARG